MARLALFLEIPIPQRLLPTCSLCPPSLMLSGVACVTKVGGAQARFIRRTLHEPNLIPIKVDPNN